MVIYNTEQSTIKETPKQHKKDQYRVDQYRMAFLLHKAVGLDFSTMLSRIEQQGIVKILNDPEGSGLTKDQVDALKETGELISLIGGRV